MFKFFTQKKWFLWAYLGSAVILTSLWLSVQIDVQINEWFGGFYDMIQKALAEPNAITMDEYMGGLWSFAKLAAMWIVLGLATSFLTSTSCLDGERRWLSFIIASMIKHELLKEHLSVFKRIPSDSLELWKAWEPVLLNLSWCSLSTSHY